HRHATQFVHHESRPLPATQLHAGAAGERMELAAVGPAREHGICKGPTDPRDVAVLVQVVLVATAGRERAGDDALGRDTSAHPRASHFVVADEVDPTRLALNTDALDDLDAVAHR